jgi:heme exporter protein C
VNCLNLFVLGGAVSLYHLIRHTPRSDLWAASGIEVGLLACTITLVTGSIWARAAWGIWWDVDARLGVSHTAWLTYAGYAARGARSTSRSSGAFWVFKYRAINVPMVYYAIAFGSHHPMSGSRRGRRWDAYRRGGLFHRSRYLRLRFRTRIATRRAPEDAFSRAAI